jgi:hypothetical protein
MDKAALWAVRGLMHRADIRRIGISSGYRCWEDNYHHTDLTRWHHRRLTFHFGKAIDFYVTDPTPCTETGKNPKAAPCSRCGSVRDLAIAKCGFQVRCIEPDRVAVAENTKESAPPVSLFSMHVNSVRRVDRQEDEFVKTFVESQQPMYHFTLGFSFPLDLGKGKDPGVVPADLYYANIEQADGGWFPLGASRIAHGGIHLTTAKGAQVFALSDGEIVGFRAGEAEDAKTLGSRNFILIRHKWVAPRASGGLGNEPDYKTYYSLYMHLDDSEPKADSPARWKKDIFLLTKDHIEPITPTPLFIKKNVDGEDRLQHSDGLAVGSLSEASGAEVAAKSIDDEWPDDARVVKLAVADAETYALTKLDGKEISKLVAKDTSLLSKIQNHEIVSLRTPIKIWGGELIGAVGGAATDAALQPLNSFLHLETFAAEMFMKDPGWEELALESPDKAVDRKELMAQLVAKGLVGEPPDKVLLDQDVRTEETDAYQEKLRCAVLKCPSAWAMDWKAALSSPACLSFMKKADADALGDRINEYRWWSAVAPAGVLPGSEVVYHYHPIALLLSMMGS